MTRRNMRHNKIQDAGVSDNFLIGKGVAQGTEIIIKSVWRRKR